MQDDAAETRDIRIKRMRMRAWRRGTKEMDLILGRFADDRLGGFDDAQLEAFDALLAEDDHDLFAWILGRAAPPGAHMAQIEAIMAFVSDEGAVSV